MDFQPALGCSFEEIEKVSNFLTSRTSIRPQVGIICGTGLGGLADLLEDQISFEYHDIPNFPVSTVAGHKGKLVFGHLANVPTVCMQGRFHFYEGYPLLKCAMPVRVMKLLGVHTVIVTNAAGGLNHDFQVGDLMLIKDHINMPGLAGDNPLRGRNDERWGPRFPPMSQVYSRRLRQEAVHIARELGIEGHLREGVYVMVGGPCYETVAECRALKNMGADAVGMSTVHEVICAKHCGLEVFGMSLITNKVVMDYDTDEEPNHEEVLKIGELRKVEMEKLITRLVEVIGKDSRPL